MTDISGAEWIKTDNQRDIRLLLEHVSEQRTKTRRVRVRRPTRRPKEFGRKNKDSKSKEEIKFQRRRKWSFR